MRSRRVLLGAAPLVVSGLVLAACQSENSDSDNSTEAVESSAVEQTSAESTSAVARAESGEAFAHADLKNAAGEVLGSVHFRALADEKTQVDVQLTQAEPGFHGFHIHAIGQCEPDSESPDGTKTGDFLSAGGHLSADDEHDHGDHQEGLTGGHAGDLPSILVQDDGTAQLTVTTDRLDQDLLFDDDGSAVIVHEGSDNFANIPSRYAPDGPDEDTLATGDAGGRALCGVVSRS